MNAAYKKEEKMHIEFLMAIGVVVVAYLIGSLSFAVMVSRIMGLADPRTFGSHNPGATNVLRSGSKAAAIATLVLDAAKAWLPMLAVRQWGLAYGWGEGVLALVGLAAFMGHLYPIFFRFKGGKGVATAAGVVLGVAPWLAAGVALTWVVIFAAWRYSSLASLVAAIVAPVLYVLASGHLWPWAPSVALAMTVMSALLLYRHQANMVRLIRGTESKLSAKAHHNE